MKIWLAYGKNGLEIEVPSANVSKVLRLKDVPGIGDPSSVLRERLADPLGAPPLKTLAAGKKNVVIVMSDITRPVPNRIILPPLLDTLHEAGIRKSSVTLLIAAGLHRPNVGSELDEMVGREIARAYRIVNHDARDERSVRMLGATSTGTPVLINALYLDAGLKITTGYIEPHIFAGFSGGRKLICPGIAGETTIKENHSPRFLENSHSREGSLEKNPLHRELLEIAEMAGCDFSIDVTLNERREVTGIFAGDIFREHEAGVAFVRGCVASRVDAPADIVITTSAGYPLDASFYQSVKGLTAALPAVRKGGTIILAASCAEGLGDSSFAKLVRKYPDMDRFMNEILSSGSVMINQWQYEELGKVLKKADVMLYSEGIPARDVNGMPVTMIKSVEAGVNAALARHGRDASIAIIPNGPYVLAECGEE